MSAPASPSSAPPARVTTPRRTLQSGFSLLARGEPKIWFTGGMLVICLAMIVALMGLILVAGLPSFWTQPIDLLALNDGTIEIGQPQKSEPSQLEGAAPGALRRYFRTGNFDITQRHYRWLEADQLGEAGIGRPEWAVVVERLEWGRLYGIPLELIRDVPPNDEARESLVAQQEASDWLNSLTWEDADVQAQVQSVLSDYRQQLADGALRECLEQLPEQPTAETQIQLASDASWYPREQLSEQAVAAVRIRWSTGPELFAALQADVAAAIGLRHEQQQVMHEVARVDGDLAELRIAIRRAELETGQQVAVQVEQAHYLLEQQAQLADRDEQLAAFEASLQEALQNEPDLAQQVAQRMADYRQQDLVTERADIDQQVVQWAQPLSAQPAAIQEAVQRYQEGYQEAVRRKRPLNLQLEETETALARSHVHMAVPNGSQPVGQAQAEDLQALSVGRLSSGLITALQAAGIEVADSAQPQIEPLCPQLQLATLQDVQQTSHMLGLIETNYLGSNETEANDLEASEADANDPVQQNVNLPARQLVVFATQTVPCESIVRVVDVNRLDWSGRFAVYVDRWREFLLENPREANTEGGVFPAIWGTIVMTLLMTIAVVPFGVMAALYLREYTKSGPLVSLIRISINNLAGVPSIVYGVFGFSFFCYTIGAFIDGGPKNADIVAWPSGWWFTVLAGVIIAGTVAFFFSIFSGGPSHTQTRAKRWMARAALVLWLASVATVAILILKSPFFGGFFPEYLPTPTYGKGGLLWASLTLALLTLPVVIVATEEALSAVPNSLREGSLACGASKWQTIRRIILPHARPGIMTGAILAMARGAGEVAPLMLVGALPSAPDLPLDGEFPFFHGSRSFQHLGYQIYTLGFQSQNSEAAKPMVFTCTLLLILIVAALNISAIYLRARLKRRFQGNQF